jgi:RNA polymerase sigma factor (sigma-70 family)
MTGTRPAEVLRHLEQPGSDNRALLGRFVLHGDQAAFADLVRRYGPLVWAACRRVAGHCQDAEDAFQAAFLVLVRRAAAIRNPELLGNWLYGVAVRVALKARHSAARRRAREVQVPTMPDPPAPTPETVSDLGPVLDEELAALAACYREAIVLCDLRGASREEAARILGIPEGTLSSRLANGRKKLASRLAKRGMALSTTAIHAAMAGEARATVPPELLAKACAIANGAVPQTISRLASGEFTMTTKWLLGVVGAVALAVGAVYAASSGDPPKPADPPKPPLVAAKPEPAPEQKPDAKPGEFTTSPRLQRAFDTSLESASEACWSRDGKSLILQGTAKEGSKITYAAEVYIDILGLDDKKDWHQLSIEKSTGVACFTPDGRIITDVREYQLISGRHLLNLAKYDYKTHSLKDSHSVNLDSAETHGYAFAADGKTFRTMTYEPYAQGAPTKLEVLEIDAGTGKKLKSLLKVPYGPYTLSADGKRLAVLLAEDKKVGVDDPKAPDGPSQEVLVRKGPDFVVVYDVDRGEKISSHKFAEKPAENISRDDRLVFSPDDTRLVVSRGLGATDVLITATGEALPALEGIGLARTGPKAHAFTSDGRLLVMPVTRYFKGPTGTPRPTSPSVAGMGITVWDTQTGKVLKTWERTTRMTVAFNPTRPLLAILEPNDGKTRLGLWDFAAELEKK